MFLSNLHQSYGNRLKTGARIDGRPNFDIFFGGEGGLMQ